MIVKHGKLSASYRLESIGWLHDYHQEDDHSCGFLAALVVARFYKAATAKEVLKAVRPKVSCGVDGDRMLCALRSLGLVAEYRDDLTLDDLRLLTLERVPVVLTIYHEEWGCDHWVVVKRVGLNRVSLTNNPSLSIPEFESQWFEHGEGIITRRSPSDRETDEAS